ncbi:hypothetical protein ACP70R_014849 [Stipagrostis hirtigluma subsp. patula]
MENQIDGSSTQEENTNSESNGINPASGAVGRVHGRPMGLDVRCMKRSHAVPFLKEVRGAGSQLRMSRSVSAATVLTVTFVDLLTALAPVRKLDLHMPLRESNAMEGLSCSFENLKSISLHTDFCMLSTILSTICLLRNAPNLEELFFQIWHDNLQQVEVGVNILSEQWTDGLLGNLKSVSMDLATCQPNEMHFIEFVLSKARRLQKFDVTVNEYCPKSNEELLVEILKYRRASPQAKVFFSRMEFI